MMTSLDARTIANVMGGDVISRDSVLVPGPGHSKADRSLSIKIDPAAPFGFQVNTFSPKDDWQTCRDYVCAALGLERGFVPSSRLTPPPRIAPRAEPSPFSLQLWSEAINARGTLVEKYLTKRGLLLPDNYRDFIRHVLSEPVPGILV
jgi:putative DNA primase/helicase